MQFFLRGDDVQMAYSPKYRSERLREPLKREPQGYLHIAVRNGSRSGIGPLRA